MKLLTLLSPVLLAATAYASDADSLSSSASSSASSTDSSSSSSSAAAASPSKPVDPPTAGAIWSPRWTHSTLTTHYTTSCHSSHTFTASVYKLAELYPALKDFAPQLKVFYNKQVYPGSWNGVDVHGDQRELLKMEYESLPYGMREWLGKNPKQRMFSVHKEEGVVFFAPGAVSPTLPVWVDESEGRGCEGVFEDLDNYTVEPKDGAVLGSIEHRSVGKNEVEITVEAFLVREKTSGRDEL